MASSEGRELYPEISSAGQMIERSLKEQLEVSFVEDSNMDRVIYLFAHMCLSTKLHIVLSS